MRLKLVDAEGSAVRTHSDEQRSPATPDSKMLATAPDRSRQIQETMTGGALGGGMLLAGFGIVPALLGAAVGATLGYLFERRVGR